MKRLIVIAALALVGCSGDEQFSITGAVDEPPPANYRELARAHLRETLFDPYTARDPMIARPVPGRNSMYAGWMTCVKVNSKNRMGAYVGQTPIAVIIRGGKVVHSISENGALFCDGVKDYEPFPELVG